MVIPAIRRTSPGPFRAASGTWPSVHRGAYARSPLRWPAERGVSSPLPASLSTEGRTSPLAKTRSLLGYHDLVGPETATRATARWLMSDEAKGMRFSEAFGGSLSYAEEDRIIAAWKAASALFAGQTQRATEPAQEPRSTQ